MYSFWLELRLQLVAVHLSWDVRFRLLVEVRLHACVWTIVDAVCLRVCVVSHVTVARNVLRRSRTVC